MSIYHVHVHMYMYTDKSFTVEVCVSVRVHNCAFSTCMYVCLLITRYI